MPPLHSFVAPRSSAARDTKSLKTPEPLAEQDVQPSPPRPRFRLRKRTASHLNAPTQNFLASVAAADVPIPSIEEPQVLDEDMIDTTYPAIVPFYPAELYAQPKRGRPYSPPRTPAPDAAPALSPTRFPDWSLDSPISSRDSSPDYESSRPSTAVSTQTSSSIFSRFSLASEDLSQCVSPEVDQSERFSRFLSVDDADRTIRISASTRARRAPWTRAMSQHLWATYMTYLQDPKVTPFRIGKSGIPPHGVCMRVAREARRSWRRFKPQSKDSLKLSESVVTLAWPHTCAATRAHLRDLCKANAGSAARDSRYLAHSPTPFGRTAGRYRNRRSAPLASPSVFSGSDMAMSLVVSTAESMQPNGPLARLTRSQPEQARQSGISTAAALSEMINAEPSQTALRSPFVARSYGPSSSNTLQDVFGIGPDQPRQTHTTGPRRLASPARLTESRPGSQKRRPAFLENRTRKRPSLASDFWTNPVHADVGSGSRLAEFSSTTSSKRDALFVPRTNLQELFETSRSMHTLGQNTNQQISGSLDAPTRLGSPFPGISSSKSLPNRFSSPARLDPGDGSGKPFATVQQAAERGTEKTTLQSRLACLDKHLRDFRRQDGQDRRSKSPRK